MQKDYTKGNLEGLVDVCIEEKVKLFVVAVGVPPKHLVDKLHAAGILYMVCLVRPLFMSQVRSADANHWTIEHGWASQGTQIFLES